MRPRVTCLMPTKDRRADVAVAVDDLLRQDYAGDLELVVLDGGESVADRCAVAADVGGRVRRVTYAREPDGAHDFGQLLTLALAAAAASPELALVWDDDNRREPGFVTALVDALGSAPDLRWAALGGQIRVEVRPAGTWFLTTWLVHDGTLLWRAAGAPALRCAGDVLRLFSGPRGVIIDRPELFVYRSAETGLVGKPALLSYHDLRPLASGDPALVAPGAVTVVSPPAAPVAGMGAVT